MPYHAVRARFRLWRGDGANATLLSPLAIEAHRALVPIEKPVAEDVSAVHVALRRRSGRRRPGLMRRLRGPRGAPRARLRRFRRKPSPKADASTGDAAVRDRLRLSPRPPWRCSRRRDLPLGHWETTEGEKLALTLLPDGLARFPGRRSHTTATRRVSSDRSTHARRGNDANTFRIWVDVTKILAKDRRPASLVGGLRGSTRRRSWASGWRARTRTGITSRAGRARAGAPPPPSSSRSTSRRATLELCTAGQVPRCRKLTKAGARRSSRASRTKAGARRTKTASPSRTASSAILPVPVEAER